MAAGEAVELLAELQELVENLGIAVVGHTLVNLRSPSHATLVGSGKVEEIVGAARLLECDVIVFNDCLVPALVLCAAAIETFGHVTSPLGVASSCQVLCQHVCRRF